MLSFFSLVAGTEHWALQVLRNLFNTELYPSFTECLLNHSRLEKVRCRCEMAKNEIILGVQDMKEFK